MSGRMKGGDQPVSGTTFEDAEDMTWALEYGKNEYFWVELFFNCTGIGSGAKFRINATEPFQSGRFYASIDGAISQVLTDVSDTIAAALAVGNHHLRIAGGYFPSNPPGRLTVQFAQNANLGGAVTLYGPSWYHRETEQAEPT